MRRFLPYILYIMCMGCMVSCSKDGEPVPDVQTELCDVHINQQYVATMITLDDGTVLDIAAQGLKADVADATIRCVVTFARENGTVRIYNNTLALCMAALPAERFRTIAHDPVKLTSVWQKGRYINMAFGEMTTGNGDHEYAFCIDSLRRRTLYTSLLHHQPAGDAASYTQKKYASMPFMGYYGIEAYDSVSFSVFTYEGLKTFVFPAVVR